jgi:mercuric ion transport protein
MSERSPVGIARTSQSALSLAVGGLAAGLLASACCILPLALALAGVTGAWIGNLTALSPYQPYFIGFAAASIGLGFWRLRRSEAACLPGSLCASPAYRRSIQLILWGASLLVASAATVDVLAPLFI